MKEYYPFIGASYLLLIRDNKILLLRRSNTGFMDGYYSLPAGHLDGEETVREGMAREALEEVGIMVRPEDLNVIHVMHRKSPSSKRERMDFFMTATKYKGEITNCEPHKCDDLSWFRVDSLPENTIDYIRAVINSYINKEFYSEVGWT